MDIEQNSIELRFTSTRLPEPQFNTVIIYPTSNQWNDFGYHIWYEFVFLSPEKIEPFRGQILVGIIPPKGSIKKDDEYNTYSLLNFLDNSDLTFIDSDKVPQFFTLLPSIGDYREIVSYLGVESVDNFLSALNDLVYYKSKTNNWIGDALNTKVFIRGFMRNSEPFFAFNNAETTFSGFNEEKFDSISSEFTLQFKLPVFDNPHEISFRFSNQGYIPRRINVLIGKNGLGKSQALKSFCRAALRYKDSSTKLLDAKNKGRPILSRVLAIATPGETGNTFPPERLKTQKLFYRRLNLTRNGRSAPTRSIGETIVQLARSEQRIGRKLRWEHFLDSLDKVLDIKNIHLKLNNDRYIPLKKIGENMSGEGYRLDVWGNIDRRSEPNFVHEDKTYPLSSGQLTYFKFALLCCLYIESGSIVLMDEPETHMHPNMISDFVGLLDYILESTDSFAIIATHSAYFVREVPKDQVHVFHQIENSISINNPRLRTFGATVDSISQFVFNEDVEVNLTDKIFAKVKNLEIKKIDEELSGDVSLAALMDIHRRMEQVDEKN